MEGRREIDKEPPKAIEEVFLPGEGLVDTKESLRYGLGEGISLNLFSFGLTCSLPRITNCSCRTKS